MAGFRGEYKPEERYDLGDMVYMIPRRVVGPWWRRPLIWLGLRRPRYEGGGFFVWTQIYDVEDQTIYSKWREEKQDGTL